MASEGIIIRAGVKSNGFMAGSVSVDVSGTFSAEDVVDIIEMLNIVIRSVRRQALSTPQKEEPHAENT